MHSVEVSNFLRVRGYHNITAPVLICEKSEQPRRIVKMDLFCSKKEHDFELSVGPSYTQIF